MPRSFKTVSKRIVYENQWSRFVEAVIDRDGEQGIYGYLDAVERRFVAVIPVSQKGRAILIRQHRFPIEKEIWEVPMGSVDPGEEPEDAARRELMEETGLADKEIKFISIGQYYPMAPRAAQWSHCYLALVEDTLFDNIKAPENMDEITDLKAFTFEEIQKMIENGELVCAKSVMVFYRMLAHLKIALW